MAVTEAQIAGLNYDRNGQPFLNISKLSLNSLNYDFNGQPLLGMIQGNLLASSLLPFFR